LAFEFLAPGPTPESAEVPFDHAPLADALASAREYTLALYRDLPAAYWEPAQFPQLDIINPPLWELGHMAWFQEFFCLRWREDDVQGAATPSILQGADALLNSSTVAHGSRWRLRYPDKAAMFDYMRDSLSAVLRALREDDGARRHLFRLALMHEHMHHEALQMTIEVLKSRGWAGDLGQIWLNMPVDNGVLNSATAPRIIFEAGECVLGAREPLAPAEPRFQFDNELSPQRVHIARFEIDAAPISLDAFNRFKHSAAYRDDRYWTAAGVAWRNANVQSTHLFPLCAQREGARAAIHVNYFEAEAYCHAHDCRLPTEAEWEHAAIYSPAFAASAGDVWEWTSTRFAPRDGFVPGAYADYSAPWFTGAVPHMVLKGGSFAAHPRLKYPQYRNFFQPQRNDVFAGFRTCARTT
jgi:gamma-glutamyl hercynylcysteine S-oxide synthase